MSSDHTCSVPSFGLPLVQLDSCVPQQCLLQKLVQRTHPVCLAKHVHIVQSRTELLSWQKSNCDLFQCLLNPNGEEEWHQRVALLPTFCSGDGSTVPFFVNPTAPGSMRMGKSHKWQNGTGFRHVLQSPQHGKMWSYAPMCQMRLCLWLPHHVPNSTRSRGQSVVEWSAFCFEHIGELRGQSFLHQKSH